MPLVDQKIHRYLVTVSELPGMVLAHLDGHSRNGNQFVADRDRPLEAVAPVLPSGAPTAVQAG